MVVLDDRLAIDELFEDVILFSGDEPVAAADQVDLLRSYLPYEVTGAERAALDQLAKIDLDERGDPAVRAARWYLRAIELGPTAEAVIFFWCALEALAPQGMTKERAITQVLRDADWNPDLLDAPPRELVQLRADIVHQGIDDPSRLLEGAYRLEAIVRVMAGTASASKALGRKPRQSSCSPARRGKELVRARPGHRRLNGTTPCPLRDPLRFCVGVDSDRCP